MSLMCTRLEEVFWFKPLHLHSICLLRNKSAENTMYHVFVYVLISAAGQLSKPFTSAILYGNSNNFDFKTVFRSGGFPSTHSSVMNTLSPRIHSSAAVATAMSLGFEWWVKLVKCCISFAPSLRGLSDAVFGLAVVYASLIMYDAQE
ncbi:uncharacterized protein LOC114322863 isoform X2 [Camellia sinensis]|uniref:uncharacterized protein LOC114322863 isoform X2 n=1 Tax=Camellia sinensis TaxID=4442 RepID=UPI00103628A5|nr:uncharacterized protein LOC114322863 isoform X2 [Camellia sinensis]